MRSSPILDPATGQRTASYRDPQLRVVFFVTLMAILGVSSVGPALPRMGEALDLPVQRIGLVITLFTLPGVVLSPLLGVAADRLGRKQVLVPALLLFALAGGACALASSLVPLLGLRFLQGIGAAALGVLNATLVGDLFAGRQRTAAMGLNASVLSVGTATYPLVGGSLAMIGWQWPFALPLLALPVAFLVVRRLREPEIATPEHLPAYLAGVWREAQSPRLLALFAASCGIFVLLYGPYVTFLPLFMDDRFGSPPIVIGLVMTMLSVVNAATASQLGRITARIPERRVVRLGFVAFALGLVLIPFAPATAALLVPAVLIGFAFGTTIPVVLSMVAGLAPDDRRAAFMSLNWTVLRLGQTLGPVLAAAVYTAGGFRLVYLAGAALALALAGLMALTLR